MFPQEIENVLISHPKVFDAAVFGLPDVEMGETIKAVIQPVEPREAGPALAGELIELCRARLAHYKAPSLGRFPRGAATPRYRQDLHAAAEERVSVGRLIRLMACI